MTGLFNWKKKTWKLMHFSNEAYSGVVVLLYLKSIYKIALRWSTTSKESYYFFFSLLIARDRCFLWLRDKYIYCLICSYLAWPLTKYKRGIILSCQMPSKNDRVKILPLSQLWGRRQSCGYKWFCAASTPRHVFKALKKTKMKLSSRSVCKF